MFLAVCTYIYIYNDIRMISHDILWVWVKIDPKEYMPNTVNPGLINLKRLFNWGVPFKY